MSFSSFYKKSTPHTREHQQNDVISFIDLKDKKECLEVFAEVFPQYYSKDMVDFLEKIVSWERSVKATVDSKIVGIYLVSNRQLEEAIKDENALPTEDISSYRNKKGIEGIALAVLPEYQKKGLGKKLKNAIESLPVDYIFGIQYKELQNLEQWLRSRRVVAQSEGKEAVYITLKDL